MSFDDHHQSHPDPNIDYHFEWEFRKEAALWMGDLAFGANFHALATEFHQWLLNKGHFSVFTEQHKGTFRSLTNPYSYHASVIATILAKNINASHAFATGSEPLDDMEADIERMRIYNEQVLYIARFCEATIKQLLHCTQIPECYYKKASLRILLSAKCSECQRSGRAPHKISMLGSLAHRYGLCIAFDQCLIEHLKIVNRRRNIETRSCRIAKPAASSF